MLSRPTKLRMRGYLLVLLSWGVLAMVVLNTATVWEFLCGISVPLCVAAQRLLAKWDDDMAENSG
jgi:hypothetical protein